MKGKGLFLHRENIGGRRIWEGSGERSGDGCTIVRREISLSVCMGVQWREKYVKGR